MSLHIFPDSVGLIFARRFIKSHKLLSFNPLIIVNIKLLGHASNSLIIYTGVSPCTPFNKEGTSLLGLGSLLVRIHVKPLIENLAGFLRQLAIGGPQRCISYFFLNMDLESSNNFVVYNAKFSEGFPIFNILDDSTLTLSKF